MQKIKKSNVEKKARKKGDLPEDIDEYILSEQYLETQIGGVNKSLDKGMAHIEKTIKKFKENVHDIRKDFLKQMKCYAEIQQKMKINHSYIQKLNRK